MSRRAWLVGRLAGVLAGGGMALSCAPASSPVTRVTGADPPSMPAPQLAAVAPTDEVESSGRSEVSAPAPDAASLAYVPGELVEIEVGFDKRAIVVFARPGQDRVLLYLHGVCGNPVAFEPWAKSMIGHATLISLVGDRPCPGGYRHKWSHDVVGIDRRARAAVFAAQAIRGEPLDRDRLTVAGYSQGALRAESLAKRFPERYPYVVLMAGPLAPSADSVAQASRVVIMAGEKDKQKHLRDAATQMASAGTEVRFIELPGARHGEYGPEAEAVMSDMLGWLYQPR